MGIVVVEEGVGGVGVVMEGVEVMEGEVGEVMGEVESRSRVGVDD